MTACAVRTLRRAHGEAMRTLPDRSFDEFSGGWILINDRVYGDFVVHGDFLQRAHGGAMRTLRYIYVNLPIPPNDHATLFPAAFSR